MPSWKQSCGRARGWSRKTGGLARQIARTGPRRSPRCFAAVFSLRADVHAPFPFLQGSQKEQRISSRAQCDNAGAGRVIGAG